MDRSRPTWRHSVFLSLLIVGGCKWEANTKIAPPAGATTGILDSGASEVPEVDGTLEVERAALWSEAQEARRNARTSLHEDELRWIATPRDARKAFLVSTETGFVPWGLETSIAEIPPGWHTGRQHAGEEAIYVVIGSGFAVIEGIRYDFAPGTTLGIPYGAERQLFNTGESRVRYFSATSFPIESYLGLYHLQQLEGAGANETLPDVPASEDGFDAQGRRIRLFWEEAQYRDGHVDLWSKLEARLRGGFDLARRSIASTPTARGSRARLASGLGHHSAWVRLMGRGQQNGFANHLVTISGLLIDEPGAKGGNHAHMEAVLYIVQGEGYSVIDGVETPWRAGSSLHVQGPQTQHQHFNTGTEPVFLLRVASGIRPLVEETVNDVFPYLWFEARGDLEPVDRDSR